MPDRPARAAAAAGAEEEALARAAAGDAAAFATLVRAHHRRVRAYLAACVRDLDVADDLAQEVFLAAFRSLGERRPEAPFALWLLGIARNRARWFLRDDGVRRAREADSFERVLARWRERGEDDDLPARERDLEALRACLDRLPGPSAALVTEHYFRRRSLVDIARALGRKEGALRMSLLRIRQALRECVRRRTEERP